MTQKARLDMEYNSQMEELIIPEYGRNVQRLIFHAKTIETTGSGNNLSSRTSN